MSCVRTRVALAMFALSACSDSPPSTFEEADGSLVPDASPVADGGPVRDASTVLDAELDASDVDGAIADVGVDAPMPMGRWTDEIGLSLADGVEPGDPSECEAVPPSRCWWVDADAPDGGDGSFERPFNSFEQVAGYEDGRNYVAGLLQGGDHLYLRGTFRGTAPGKERRLLLERGTQGGTPSAPTVIRSYSGSPRAVFDGEGTQSDLIYVRGHAQPFGALVLRNIEVARARARGINLGDRTELIEVHDVYVHDTRGDGNIGTGGGLLFNVLTGLRHFELHHCLFVNNDVDPVGGSNNRGGLTILSELADPASTVIIHHSIFRGENHAIRHKHSGTILMEAHDNYISDSASAFYLRTTHNRVHDNLIVNVGTAFRVWDENRLGDSEAWIDHNTVVDTRQLLRVLSDDPRFTRRIHVVNNIISTTPCADCPFVELGRWGSDYGVNIDEWTFGPNLFDFDVEPSPFLTHKEIGVAGNAPPLSFDEGLTRLMDRGSFRGGPAFVDREAGDYRLSSESPARGAASDGSSLGAFQ